MTILVTGASGFIGGYIVCQLAKNTQYQIIATGRTQTHAFDNLSNVKYQSIDLSNDIPDITCDVCIHCAGLADDRASQNDYYTHNQFATQHLLKAISGCNQFIFISSSSVYDFSDGQVKYESDASISKQLSLYGMSKLQTENVIRASDIDSITILRPRAVYGQGDRVLLPRILKMVRKYFILAPGKLKTNSSMTHIQNLYESIQRSLDLAKSGVHIFNIADKEVYSLRNVIGIISKQKYGHQRFIIIPLWVISTIIQLSRILKIKTSLTQQGLNYLSQNSVLNTDLACKHLNLNFSHNFYNCRPYWNDCELEEMNRNKK